MVWSVRKSNSKYYAQSTRYNDRLYHSKFEAQYAHDLDLELRAGKYTEIIPQYKISLDVNGYHICNYIVDFKVVTKDGEIQYHEVKGFETDIWRFKWKLLEAIYSVEHPDIKLIVIK